jgi:hypothetical protein
MEPSLFMALLTASFMVPMARLPFINPSPGHKTMHARQAQGKDARPGASMERTDVERTGAERTGAEKNRQGSRQMRIWARTRGLPEGPTGL